MIGIYGVMVHLDLDRRSPMPLYHQIVQAIRWQIGTGVLRAGDLLPPIRDAAGEWEVNYHTVRRAYNNLAEQGWVESVQGAGTRVAAAVPAVRKTTQGLERWVDDVINMGSTRFGLSAAEIAGLIHAREGISRVVMVECSIHQASVLARQLEEAWLVEAIPWDLAEGEPPQLPIIGTYFHHAEMKQRWPHRVGDMHFVAVRTDPGLRERIEAAAPGESACLLRLVEQDPATAREMAAGVAEILPDRFIVEPVVGDPEELLCTLPAGALLLVAPRFWDRLSESVKKDERVLDVQPTIVGDQLRSIWRALGSGPIEPA